MASRAMMTLPTGTNYRNCELRIVDCGLSNSPIRNPQFEIRNSPSGFTFIELVFVTLVLGILLVSALPKIQGGWSRLQTERIAFQLAQTLRTARTLAIAQGQPIDWMWDSQAQHVWLVTEQSDGTVVPVPGRLGQPHPIPQSVKLSVLQSGQPVQKISFFPDGTSQSTSLLIGGTTTPLYQIGVDGSTSQVVVH